MAEIKAWDNLGFTKTPPSASNEFRQDGIINSTKATENTLYGKGKPYRHIITADLRKDDTSNTKE